ncbi:hypothetical protein DFH29DRAFT_945720 [Suillus ampliporus]|nr:hypothetical protein DFH29DRAFT_945720 [Suillus ampliporus]
MSQSKGVALVTGSAQGLGRAIAIRLAQDGFDVALNDLPAKQTVGKSDGRYHPRTCVVPCDVSKEDEVKHMIDTAVDVLGSLDVVSSKTIEGWERVMQINATSAFLCYKYAALQMVKQGRGGRIIAEPELLSYSLTQSAALQLGRYGITVNSYAPGIIETPMLIEARAVAENRGDEVDYFQKKINASAVGYIGQPENVASAVAYLASKEAHFITGKLPFRECYEEPVTQISIDGGLILS